MKKRLAVLLLGFIVSSFSYAGDQEEKHVREMYNLSLGLNYIKDGRVDDNGSIFYNYSSDKIKSLLNRDSNYEKKTGNLGCLGHNIIWQGNDFDTNAKLTFMQQGKDKIKVTIGKTMGLDARSVTYQVQCKGSSCKITEVYEDNYTKPFTKRLSGCLGDMEKSDNGEDDRWDLLGISEGEQSLYVDTQNISYNPNYVWFKFKYPEFDAGINGDEILMRASINCSNSTYRFEYEQIMDNKELVKEVAHKNEPYTPIIPNTVIEKVSEFYCYKK